MKSVFSTEDFLNLIKADAVDIIKVKVMKHGGIIKTLNMMNMAKESGIRCVIGHGFNLLLNATAEAFLAGISDNVLFPGEMVGPLKLRDDIFEGGGRIERGKFLLSGTEDGFGVALHEDKFNKYRLREEA